MGVYVYKTKPTATAEVIVKTDDGCIRPMTVQVYEYAYKVHRDDYVLHQRIVAPAQRAFAKRGTNPLPHGVIGYNGMVGLGDPVFLTRGFVSAIEIGENTPVGKIVNVRKGVKLLHSPVV